jgi:lauroyl/myristoyl acyltransferase
LVERLSVFGDLPTRALKWGVGLAPWFLEPVVTGMWTVLFFLVAGGQRRAVCANLSALFPGSGRLTTLGRALRVFWTFAQTYVDAVRCKELGEQVDWVIDGLEHLEDVSSRSEGCIILTAHMGNYDLAAPLFAAEFGRTLHTVRAPERNPQLHAMHEAELRDWEQQYPFFKVHYNMPGEMLGVELAKYLAAGEVVAVQADRVLFDVSQVAVDAGEGRKLILPRGPLMLAQATGAPCFPLFILRDGWRRYRVQVMPALEVPKRRRGQDASEAVQVWADTLLGVVRRHWWQWFVFEMVFESPKK